MMQKQIILKLQQFNTKDYFKIIQNLLQIHPAIVTGNKQEVLIFVFTHRCVFIAQILGLSDLDTMVLPWMNGQE